MPENQGRITPEICRKAGLTEREEYIILSLDGWFGEPKTADQIGKIMAVTRIRIEDIEKTARAKLTEAEEKP